MKLNHRESIADGEELYYGVHPSGLKIYIIPKKGCSKSYAIFGTRYGSVDSEFIVPGETSVTKVPDGIAHYLEHKMFDQPDGTNAFDKFSKYGANANAFTSFNMTGYLFSATSGFNESLAALLDYVQSPYFTAETVSKEQGIIGQEIRMYDDNGGWKVFFNLLNCLYVNHPVKKEIAGTIESISHITHDLLYRCYNTFYNPSNMTIVVSGNVDPDAVMSVIEDGIKKNEPFSEEIRRIYPDEPNEVASHYFEQRLSVAAPLFMAGFKDTDTGFSGDALLKKYIETNIILKMLFGKSSALYKRLYDDGLINRTFSSEYTAQPDYAYAVIEGESQDPKRVYDEILTEVKRAHENGLNEDDYNRIKNVIWGEHIRAQNDAENMANELLQLSLMGVDCFNYYDVYKSVTFEDVKARFARGFTADGSALSVVNPTE